MLGWLMLLGASLASSVHCVGMCGPIVVSIGATAPTPTQNLARQLLHATGRTFTYVWLGAMTGLVGQQLSARWDRVVHIQGFIGITAGLFLIFQGLRSIGWIRRKAAATGTNCAGIFGLGGLFRARDLRGAFLAGIATGFLPCGLVWGFLGLAAATGNMAQGAAIMLALGLGTMPALLATGCGSAFASARIRGRLNFFAGCCLLLAGDVTLARAVGAFVRPVESEASPCPMHVWSGLEAPQTTLTVN